jgi:tRNA 2-thiouridine synthesizing protein A
MPIVETHIAMRALVVGEVLEIVATDPGTRNDIPAWCARTGNPLLTTSDSEHEMRYYVRKGS